MTTATYYPKSITQTTGGTYRTWKNTNNIKNISNSAAESNGLIHGKNSTPNRPSTITATQFGINLPTGAIIQKITVEYWHQKTEYQHKTVNIPAPSISLVGLGTESVTAKKGAVPTGVMTNHSVSWSFTPTVSKVQAAAFGVKINYPKNANNNEGYMKIRCIRVQVTYKTPAFSVNFPNAQADVTNKAEYQIGAALSNKNRTDYNPTCTLTIPAGFTLKKYAPGGVLTKVNSLTYTWKPTLSRKTTQATLSMVFDVDVTYASGATSATGTFALTEGLTGATTSKTVTIRDPEKTDTTPREGDGDDNVIKDLAGDCEWNTTKILNLTASGTPPTPGDVYELTIKVPKTQDGQTIISDRYVRISPVDNTDNFSFPRLPIRKKGTTTTSSDYINGYYQINEADFDSNDEVIVEFPAMAYISGVTKIKVDDYSWTKEAYFEVSVAPKEESLTVPTMSHIIIDDTEELARLGEGITYTAESLMKVVTEKTAIPEWHKNFRIGVFNNPILANLSSVIEYGTTTEDCQVLVTIPATIPQTSSGVRLHVYTGTSELTFTDNTGTSTTIQGYGNLTVFDYTSPFIVDSPIPVGNEVEFTVQFQKQVTIEDGGGQVITWETEWEQDYKIKFLASSDYVEEKITDSTDYDNLTDTQIFENAIAWSKTPSTVNTWTETTVDFTYNPDYPLILIFTEDFKEDLPKQYTLKYTTPIIIEKNRYTTRQTEFTYPVPIDNVITESLPAETIMPKLEQATPIITYNPNLPEGTGTDEDTVVQGIEITLDLNLPTSAIFYAKIYLGDEVGTRSVIVNESHSQVVFGGKDDTWGFLHSELINLETVEVEIYAFNNTYTEAYLNYNNAQLTLYTETLETEAVTVKIDGEDLRYYGAFVEDISNPQGLNTKTNYLTIDGTDTNDSYRQTIETKEITLELTILDCDVTNKTQRIQKLAALITNDRDIYHRPIPKRLELSNMPDHYYEYICEDSIENELDFSSATVKIKLQIPAGTAYAKEDTVTGSTGVNSGLCAVKPIINITATGNTVTLTEETSKQKFTVTYNSLANKNLVIDCENQTCTIITESDDDTESKQTDITSYCDINNDWFQLTGEYSFTIDGGVLSQVKFTERW